MRPHKRWLRLVVGLVLVVASLAAVTSGRRAPDPMAYVPQAPPQRALGDFDGDGRIDTALIQDRAGSRQISVQLSGSASPVHLEASVTGVIEGDVDHDGDLDLVAATTDGDVLVWLNDGHGRFTLKVPSSKHGFSSDPVVAHASWPESMAISISATLLPWPIRGEATLVVTQICPPTVLVPHDVRRSILPALRAPPVDLS